MRKGEHARAHHDNGSSELRSKGQRRRTLGRRGDAMPREARRQGRERKAAGDDPDKDEARVALPLDGILDGGMHEPGKSCLDRRRPFDSTQHGLAPACRALLASGAGILASAT